MNKFLLIKLVHPEIHSLAVNSIIWLKHVPGRQMSYFFSCPAAKFLVLGNWTSSVSSPGLDVLVGKFESQL